MADAAHPAVDPTPHARLATRVAGWATDPYCWALVGLALGYLLLFTGLAWHQHQAMRTHKADLGQIDQAIWNSSQGRFLQFTENDATSIRLTDHVEPIFLLISPLFWLWDDVRALLVLQVAAAALGAFFLYALALEKFDQLLTDRARRQIWHREPLRRLTRPLALALSAAYLLAPQLQSALLTEFHAIPLAVPLILWAFWAVEKRHWRQFALALLLVASVKEEAALLAAGLGLWAMARLLLYRSDADAGSQQPRRGPLLLAGALSLLSLLWFGLTTFVIVPHYANQVYAAAESSYFQRYGTLGDSPLQILTSVITRPGTVLALSLEPARAAYLLRLLALGGFLSLLAPEILLLCLPLLLANSLSAYPAQYYGEFHYSAPLVPYMFVSSAYGAARLWRWVGRRVTSSSPAFQQLPAANPITMAAAALVRNAGYTVQPLLAMGLVLWILAWAGSLYAQAGRGPGGGRYDPTPVGPHQRLLSHFVAQLPADAAVTATAAVHPHISHRRHAYQFPAGLAPAGLADWALLDVTTNTDMAPGDLQAAVEAMLAGEWGVVDGADGFLLLQKGQTEKGIPPAFYSFTRLNAPGAAASSPLAVAFDPPITFGPLQLTGLELDDWPRWRQTKIVTEWQVEAGYDGRELQPWLELRTPDGRTVQTLADAAAPALLWYPPAQWQAGDRVRITTAWLYLPRVWGIAAGAAQPHGPVTLNPQPSTRLTERDGALALVAAFQRTGESRLASLPIHWTPGETMAHLADPVQSTAMQAQTATLTAPDSTSVQLLSWLPDPAPWPGGSATLWLHWSALPPGTLPFVHLRANGANQSQNDGPPRYFVVYPAAAAAAAWGSAWDWRALPLPAGAAGSDWRLVVGLYNPLTGARLPITGPDGSQGNEQEVGRLHLAPPPTPDQACALIPAACASQ